MTHNMNWRKIKKASKSRVTELFGHRQGDRQIHNNMLLSNLA